MVKSIAWPFVAIQICKKEGKTASYNPQYFPCFHSLLNKDISIIGVEAK